MSERLYQIRRYGERLGDFQLVESWMHAHGRDGFKENLMPTLGVFVCREREPGGGFEECAVAWLHLDNSIGVCHIDHIVTCAGLSGVQAFEALRCAAEFLIAEAQSLNYGHMVIYTTPLIARLVERLGFSPRVEGLVMLSKTILPP